MKYGVTLHACVCPTEEGNVPANLFSAGESLIQAMLWDGRVAHAFRM